MDILELNKKAYDNIGERVEYPEILNKEYLSLLNLFCKLLPAGSNILDIGCGPGIPITKESVDRGFDVTGIDISDKMIELAKKNIPKAAFEKISMTDISFNDKFDGIVSSYSMLLLDPENFRKASWKIMDALKGGGYFLLSLNEPTPEGHKEEENFIKIMGQRMFSRPYTEGEIREYFSGMKIIKVEISILTSENYGTEYCLMMLMQKRK